MDDTERFQLLLRLTRAAEALLSQRLDDYPPDDPEDERPSRPHRRHVDMPYLRLVK